MAIQKSFKDVDFDRETISNSQFENYTKILKTHTFNIKEEVGSIFGSILNGNEVTVRLICEKCNIKCHYYYTYGSAGRYKYIFHTSQCVLLNINCDEVIIKGIIE